MLLALSARCLAADGPGSTLGRWTGSSQMFETDFTPAAVIQDRTKCAWSDERLFLICQQSAIMNKPFPSRLTTMTLLVAQTEGQMSAGVWLRVLEGALHRCRRRCRHRAVAGLVGRSCEAGKCFGAIG